eukprot:2024481-Rhodomonas_salina.2
MPQGGGDCCAEFVEEVQRGGSAGRQVGQERRGEKKEYGEKGMLRQEQTRFSPNDCLVLDELVPNEDNAEEPGAPNVGDARPRPLLQRSARFRRKLWHDVREQAHEDIHRDEGHWGGNLASDESRSHHLLFLSLLFLSLGVVSDGRPLHPS